VCLPLARAGDALGRPLPGSAHSPPLRQPIPPRLVSRHRCSTGRLSLQSLAAISPNSPYPPPVVIWVFVATIRTG
jgi:hypothetical protein